MSGRIVFAYTGAPGSWAAISSIAAARHCDIVTVTIDLGQGGDLEEVRDRALAAGCLRAHVLDGRDEFARDYLLPALHAGILDERHDPAARRLARPLIGRKLAEIGAIEQATDTIDLAVVQATLWGRAGAGYTLTKAAADAPGAHAEVEIAFDRGVPVALNGIAMTLTELIEIVAIIAGSHGIGRIEVADGPAEAPAAAVLRAAHQTLETRVSIPDLARIKQELSAGYAALLRDGQWWSPGRSALDALNAKVQEPVTGAVRMRLLKGVSSIVEIRHSASAPADGGAERQREYGPAVPRA